MNITSFFGTLALVAWLVFVGVLGFVILRASRDRPIKNGGWFIAISLVVAVISSSVSAGMVFINPDERGIVISALQPKGYREDVLTPGLRWVIPYFESVVTYKIGRQTYTMSIAPNEGAVKGDDSITARTQDGQELLVDASVIFAIDPNKVIQVHIYWKDTYVDNLIRPQARGAIRDVISQYGVQDVVSNKRLEMTEKIRQQLDQKLSDNGLVLVDFIVRNLTFSTEYAASVEQKQIAEQQAQQAKFVVESKKQEAEQARQVAQGQADAAVIRAKGDADARIIQADAETKALNLIASALKDNPSLLSYQYISKLAPNTQVMLLPNNAPFLYNLPGIGTSATTGVPQSTVPTTIPTTVPTAQPTPTATKTP